MAKKKKNHSGGGTYAQPGPGAQGPVRRTKPPKSNGGTYATNESGARRPRGTDNRPYPSASRSGRPYSEGVQTPRSSGTVWRTDKAVPNKDDIQALYNFPQKTGPAAAPSPFDAFASLINQLVPQQPAINLQDYLKPYDELDASIERQALLNAAQIIRSDANLRDQLAGTTKADEVGRMATRTSGIQSVEDTTAATQDIYGDASANLTKFGVPGGVTPALEEDKARALQDLAGQRQDVVDYAKEDRLANDAEANSRTWAAGLVQGDAEAALQANKTAALLQSAQGRAAATGDYNAAVTGQQQQDYQNKLAAVQGLGPVFDQYAEYQAQQARQPILEEVQGESARGANPGQELAFRTLTGNYETADEALADLELQDRQGLLAQAGIGPGQKAQIVDWITRWYAANPAASAPQNPLEQYMGMAGRVQAVR